jgi:hypothetical protein
MLSSAKKEMSESFKALSHVNIQYKLLYSATSVIFVQGQVAACQTLG